MKNKTGQIPQPRFDQNYSLCPSHHSLKANCHCASYRGTAAVQQGFLIPNVPSLCAPSLVCGIWVAKKMSNTHCWKAFGAPSGPLWQAHTVAAGRGQSSTLITAWCLDVGRVTLLSRSRGALAHYCSVTFHRDNAAKKRAQTKVRLSEAN